jgi:hypothetical protein
MDDRPEKKPVTSKMIFLLFFALIIITAGMRQFGPRFLFLVAPAGFIGGTIIGMKQRERERDD